MAAEILGLKKLGRFFYSDHPVHIQTARYGMGRAWHRPKMYQDFQIP